MFQSIIPGTELVRRDEPNVVKTFVEVNDSSGLHRASTCALKEVVSWIHRRGREKVGRIVLQNHSHSLYTCIYSCHKYIRARARTHTHTRNSEIYILIRLYSYEDRRGRILSIRWMIIHQCRRWFGCVTES